VNLDDGAEAIMDALGRVQPLDDADGEPGTHVGGMLAQVRDAMSDVLSDVLADVRSGDGTGNVPGDAPANGAGGAAAEIAIRDVLAVDTFVPAEVRGGLAGEVALENAVALAAMVRTSGSRMRLVAERVSAGLGGLSVEIGGVEGEMAALGALTTPGVDTPIAVLDLGGGSTDAALLTRDGECTAVHLAGAGELVTKLIDSELALDNREVAEAVKRHPLAKVESFFHVRHEDGTVQFHAEPLPPSVFAKVVTLGPDGPAPVDTRHGLDHVRRVRREAKRRVFAVNAVRALRQVAPGGNLRALSFVVLLGGSALDFEIPDLIADALAGYGIVCGTGNVHGTEGPRNAVASGLVDAYARRR
jgi:diol dehydratase reactivase alpha subunit